MKKSILVLLFLASAKLVNAQQPIDTANNNNVYTAVEVPPTFAGPGTFADFLGHNIIYPAKSAKDHVQGRVIVQFVINTNGEVDNAKILRPLSAEVDTEALRVIRLTRWHPGTQNGRKVRAYFTVPLNFTMNK